MIVVAQEAVTIMRRWSNGKDSSLPWMRSGFDSPTAHVLLQVHARGYGRFDGGVVTSETFITYRPFYCTSCYKSVGVRQLHKMVKTL